MSTPGRVLVVDDDLIVAQSIAACLEQAGHDVVIANDGREALAEIASARQSDEARSIAVMITDMAMPGMDGLELIQQVLAESSTIVPVAISGYATIERAVAAVKHGAMDVLTKPMADEELRLTVAKAMQQHALRQENAQLRRTVDRLSGLDGIVGADLRMSKIFELIESVAPTKTTVLMTGESGTGKSLLARAIHRRSARADKPFVEISCGSIPETLLESELFGHVKGAFTGAHADKKGRFLAAHGGTIFLDEINSASPGMQLKLLRVLQERKFEPVGSTETVEVDVRVILASNQPLEELVRRGEFRQDLYYRINVVAIALPALRERDGDIPMLARHFLHQHAEELGKSIEGFSDEALAAMRKYDFPGNVRELENLIERACVLAKSSQIQLNDLTEQILAPSPACTPAPHSASPWLPRPLLEQLAEAERAILRQALDANEWNRQKTAEALSINRTTLYKKMRTLGLDRASA
jgi:two-component system response regulator AtoC